MRLTSYTAFFVKIIVKYNNLLVDTLQWYTKLPDIIPNYTTLLAKKLCGLKNNCYGKTP